MCGITPAPSRASFIMTSACFARSSAQRPSFVFGELPLLCLSNDAASDIPLRTDSTPSSLSTSTSRSFHRAYPATRSISRSRHDVIVRTSARQFPHGVMAACLFRELIAIGAHNHVLCGRPRFERLDACCRDAGRHHNRSASNFCPEGKRHGCCRLNPFADDCDFRFCRVAPDHGARLSRFVSDFLR